MTGKHNESLFADFVARKAFTKNDLLRLPRTGILFAGTVQLTGDALEHGAGG